MQPRIDQSHLNISYSRDITTHVSVSNIVESDFSCASV